MNKDLNDVSHHLVFSLLGGGIHDEEEFNPCIRVNGLLSGCLSTSTDRFLKYFRIGHDRFEDIYSKAARSGEFVLNPLEPMYGELHPGGPIRHGCAQVKKMPPLCLKMAASFRRLATGQSFASLAEEFRIRNCFDISTLTFLQVLRLLLNDTARAQHKRYIWS